MFNWLHPKKERIFLVSPEEINKAYERLEDSRQILYNAEVNRIASKNDYLFKKGKALLDHVIMGSNEELREAAARDYLNIEAERYDESIREFNLAEFNYDMARLNVERIHTLLLLE